MSKSTTPSHPFQAHKWQLAHSRQLILGPTGLLMGVLNVTPDSFSDGGSFDGGHAAISQANRMLEEGATIIDIGGESTKPNAEPVSEEVEQSRVLPVVEWLARQTNAIISIDTYRASTAEKAIAAGAHIINDVWGFQKDPEMAKIAAATSAGCCLMHTGRKRERDRHVVNDQIAFLSRSVEIALKAGVNREAIVLDPGIGFAKSPDEDIELLANLERMHRLGFPVMTGTSRKRFLGRITGREVGSRDVATAATTVVARLKGSAVIRIHDVATNMDALKITDAILSAKKYEEPA